MMRFVQVGVVILLGELKFIALNPEFFWYLNKFVSRVARRCITENLLRFKICMISITNEESNLPIAIAERRFLPLNLFDASDNLNLAILKNGNTNRFNRFYRCPCALKLGAQFLGIMQQNYKRFLVFTNRIFFINLVRFTWTNNAKYYCFVLFL